MSFSNKKPIRNSSYQFERLSASQGSVNNFSLPQYASSPPPKSSSSSGSFRSSLSSDINLRLFTYDNSPFANVSLLDSIDDRKPFIEDFSSDDGISFKRRTYWFGLAFLILVVILYIAASTASIAVIKFINNDEKIYLPVFTALLHKAMWPVHLIIFGVYAFKSKTYSKPSIADIGKYLVLGFLSGAVDIFGMYGLNKLQGSTYTILRSGDLVFSLLLSQIVLRKRFTIFHYIAGLLILAAVIINGVTCVLGDSSSLVPLICTLVGCLFESINTILSDRLLKNTSRRRMARKESNYLLITEGAFFINFFAFLFLLIPVFATREFTQYEDDIRNFHYFHLKTWAFSLVIASVALSRFAVRITKYWIVEKRSAFTFSVLKPVRRVLSAILLIFFFSEGFTWPKLAGMGLTLLAFGIYLMASKWVSQRQKELRSDVVQRQPSPADT
eukprot:TRINITY_DN6669_c0_g1_i1.p1 TRINITY_DN6669_c0_g1~~TRINITY_DN6669_c0_g1_i1.p1  ORF type:complete len:443 (+),score=109.19 TRINITY_DN6669_c0_g1_i1:142-1470(+)